MSALPEHEPDQELSARERLERALFLLDESNKAATSPEEDRKLMTWQIAALFDIAVASGIPMSRLSRSYRLMRSLEDLDHGTVADFLKPRRDKEASARPLASLSLWEARAAAVIAFETQKALGQPPRRAAEIVNENLDLSRLGAKREAYNVLRDWTDRFAQPPGIKAPGGGRHWDLLAEMRARIERFERIGLDDERRLFALYRGMIRHAAGLLPECLPKKPSS
jgi:hypothetical protein